MSSSTLPLRFDALDPMVQHDPYPVYDELRSAGPLCRMGPGAWGVTRHRDIVALQNDPRLGSEFPPQYHAISTGDGPASAFFSRIMLYRDPPEHVRLRRLMGKAFRGSLVRRIRDTIEEMVDRLLEPALARGELDVVRDLAYPLPVMVISRLMGLPPAHHEDVRRYAMDLGRAFSAFVPPESREAADVAVEWLRAELGAVLRERSEQPRDDLLSQLLAAGDGEDALTHEEIVDNTVFAFFAGFETTVHLIATGSALLLSHPGQLEKLRAQPELVTPAVEEFLRYDAPIQGTARMVRESIELGGRTVRRGRVLVLMLGSGNRDPEVFASPDTLDIGRDPNPHLAFGGGSHLCLGAFLARMEGQIVFDRLSRLRTFAPGGEVVRELGTPFRALATVPARIA